MCQRKKRQRKHTALITKTLHYRRLRELCCHVIISERVALQRGNDRNQFTMATKPKTTLDRAHQMRQCEIDVFDKVVKVVAGVVETDEFGGGEKYVDEHNDDGCVGLVECALD